MFAFATVLLANTISDAITRAVYEVAEDACKDGVKYLEIRFSPVLHTREGTKYLSLNDVRSQFESSDGRRMRRSSNG